MNSTLLDFERRIGVGPTYAARLLGSAYSTYAAYRSESRELPLYQQTQIRAILYMNAADRDRYVNEYAYES